MSICKHNNTPPCPNCDTEKHYPEWHLKYCVPFSLEHHYLACPIVQMALMLQQASFQLRCYSEEYHHSDGRALEMEIKSWLRAHLLPTERMSGRWQPLVRLQCYVAGCNKPPKVFQLHERSHKANGGCECNGAYFCDDHKKLAAYDGSKA